MRALVQKNQLPTAAGLLRSWGPRGVAARTVKALRAGGPALVWNKIRTLIALNRLADATRRLQSMSPPARIAEPPRVVQDGVGLASDFSLTEAEWRRWAEKTIAAEKAASGSANVNVGLFIALMSADAEPEVLRAAIAAMVALPTAGWRSVTPVGIGVGAGAADARTTADLGALAAMTKPEDFVLFVYPGDVLHGDALALLAAHAAGKALTLFDMYFVEEERAYPLLLPGIDDVHAGACDYFRSRALVRGDVLAAAQTKSAYDVVAAICARRLAGDDLPAVHIAAPLLKIAETKAAIAAEREALLTAPHQAAAVQGRISVIICTKNKGHLVRQLVHTLLRDQSERLADIILVSNQSTNAYALQTLAECAKMEKVEVVAYDAPFNFSRQCNLGAASARGEFLLFLNDDIAPVTGDWLEQLLAPFADPTVGATGPLLLYPDERVQHAGMYLGLRGIAGHTLRFARLPEGDYLFTASAPREVSALTGAVLLMRRGDFEALGGFDPLFATFIQDVDLCMRLAASDKRLIYTPRAILIHMESASLNDALQDDLMQRKRVEEQTRFNARWGDAVNLDPHHNPNFARNDESLRTLARRS